MKILDIALPYQRRFILSKKKRKLWIASRQVGKSWAIASLLVERALEKHNGLSLCISTGARASSEIVKKAAQFAEAVKKLSNGQIDYTSGYDHVNFSNGSRVMSLPSTTDGANLRGFTAQCVCIDEAAYIPHLEDLMQAIAPTLSRDKNSELVMTSTPAGKNGYFYDRWIEAQDDDAWYVQTTTIHDAIREGLQVDLDSLHTLCPDPDMFAQEYECVFQNELGSWLDPSIMTFEDVGTLPGPTWLGLDVGVKHDSSGIVIGAARNGQLVIDYVAYMRQMQFQEQFDCIKSLCSQHNVTAGFVDAVGIGYGLSERIQREVNAKIKPFQWTGTNKTPAYEQFKTDVIQRKIVFSKRFEQMLLEDVKMVSRLVTPDGKTKYTAARSSLGHGDIASALVLCHQAWRSMPQNISMPTAVPMFSVF